MAEISVNPSPNHTKKQTCVNCDGALLNALIALLKALNAHKTRTIKCECRASDPHMMNGEHVCTLIQCTICADINRAQFALSAFRSADDVVISICKCNKH